MSMPQQAKASGTVEDYYGIPEGWPRTELIDGEFIMPPAPSLRHQRICRELKFLIHSYLKQNPIGEIFFAPCDVILSQFSVLQPDLVFLLKEHADILTAKAVEGAPDLVVEILSESTGHLDRGAKMQVYVAAGVREYWIIDPEQDTVEVFHPREHGTQPTRTLQLGDTLETPLLPDLKLPLKDFLAR